jgi:hypothetical protein
MSKAEDLTNELEPRVKTPMEGTFFANDLNMQVTIFTEEINTQLTTRRCFGDRSMSKNE